MKEVFSVLLQAIITVVIPILTTFAINFLRAKAEQMRENTKSGVVAKHISEAEQAVETAVLYVSQTYVDALKQSGTFTAENQREALKRAGSQAKSLLTADAAQFLNEVYGDVNTYLAAKIEAKVRQLKAAPAARSAAN